MQGEIATTPSLNLTLEQKHVIKELIKDMKMEPAAMPVRAGVGDIIPQDIDLKSVPSEPRAKYRKSRRTNCCMQLSAF